MLLPWDQLSPAEARADLNDLLGSTFQWHFSCWTGPYLTHIFPGFCELRGEVRCCAHWEAEYWIPASLQGLCASVCKPALLLQPLTLTVSLGFSCLAGNAGLSEIHTFVSNGKLEMEDASRYLCDFFCLIWLNWLEDVTESTSKKMTFSNTFNLFESIRLMRINKTSLNAS